MTEASPSIARATPPEPLLYLMPGCGICHQVKAYLESLGIPPQLCWITEPEHESAFRALLERLDCGRTVPLLVLGEEAVQGFRRVDIDQMLVRAGYDLQDANSAANSGLDEDCPLPANALWVANFLDGSISFFDPESRAREIADLRCGQGSNPMAIGYDPDTGVAAVSDYGLHCLYFFDIPRRTLLGGSARRATLATPDGPADIVVDRRRHRFYVPATQAGMVLAIDSRTGLYANGNLENSSVAVGRPLCGGIAIDPLLDRIFFGAEGDLLAIDLESFALSGEPLPVGVHRGIAVDSMRGRVHVASSEWHVVIQVDGRTLDYAGGSLESSLVKTQRTPFAIAVDEPADRVFVSCLSSAQIQVAKSSAPLIANLPALDAAETTRTFAWIGKGLLGAASFDSGEISFIDTDRAGYRRGERRDSAIAVATGARGIAWIGNRPAFDRQAETT